MCEMRRKDREMNKEFAYKVMDKARFATLSMLDTKGQAYGIPISFARDNEIVYFHSALEGKKVDILKQNPFVSMSFVGEVQVPNLYTPTEIESLIEKGEFTILARRVYTTEFESTIITGKVSFVENKEEKIKALHLICEKYTPDYLDYFNFAIESSLKHVHVFRLDLKTISAKRKKYDELGEEMKWGRV